MKLRKHVASTVSVLNKNLEVVDNNIVIPAELIEKAIESTGTSVDELKKAQSVIADVAVGVNIVAGRTAKEYFAKHKDVDKITYSTEIGKHTVNGRVLRENTFKVVGTDETVTHPNHVSANIKLRFGTTSQTIREVINASDIEQFIG